MKPPKIAALVRVVYACGFTAAYSIGNTFGSADRFGSHAQSIMPMYIGLIGLAPYVILFGYLQLRAPFATRAFVPIFIALFLLLLIPKTAVFALLLPLPMTAAALYASHREVRRVYELWLRGREFLPVPNPPAVVVQKLGVEGQWQCYGNRLTLEDGREIPYLMWVGTGTSPSLTQVGGSTIPLKTKAGLLAFSFAAQDVSEPFTREMKARSLAKLSLWQRLRPSHQQQSPYLAEQLPDGTFVVAWTMPPIASLLEAHLHILAATLEKSHFSPHKPPTSSV